MTAIADVHDAIAADHRYHKGMPVAEALRTLYDQCGILIGFQPGWSKYLP